MSEVDDSSAGAPEGRPEIATRKRSGPSIVWLIPLVALVVAGWLVFTTFADKSDIRIVRRGDNGAEIEYRFDYNAYIKGRAPGTNIVLQPGDTIIVPD